MFDITQINKNQPKTIKINLDQLETIKINQNQLDTSTDAHQQ